VLPKGGLEACAYYVGRELARRHRVTVLTARLAGEASEEDVDGIEVYRCGTPRRYVEYGDLWGRYQFAQSATRQGRHLRPDVVVGYGLSSFWVAHRIARATEARAVAFVADVYLDFWHRIASPLPALIGRCAEVHLLRKDWDSYIAISHATAERLQRLGIGPGLITVIPPPIDVEAIRRLRVAKDGLGPIVSCVARHVSYKGIDVLIRAVAELAGEFPDIRCHLVGSGILTDELRVVAANLGVLDRVAFLGTGDRHSFAWEVIKGSDVLCLPSHYEGFGMPVAEALAAGIPVVCSDIPALREVTEMGTAGLLFPPGDATALARQLRRVLVDRALSSALTRAGEAVASTLTCDRVAARTDAQLLAG
jgi:glycosyltransferase involved in cell wall biosynthesis